MQEKLPRVFEYTRSLCPDRPWLNHYLQSKPFLFAVNRTILFEQKDYSKVEYDDFVGRLAGFIFEYIAYNYSQMVLFPDKIVVPPDFTDNTFRSFFQQGQYSLLMMEYREM